MDRRPASDRSPALHHDAADEVDVADERDEVREEIRATLAALMPWGVSIAAHLVLVALAFFLVWQTIERQPEQVVVPTLDDPIKDPERSMLAHEPEPTPESGGSMISPQVTPTETEPTDIGFTSAVQPSFLPAVGTNNNGRFPGDDDGNPDGFYDTNAPPANRIVVVIDASGSMVDVLPFVIDEVKYVINNRMTADQRLTIVMFSGEGVFEVPGADQARGLRPLTPQFVRQINQWVSLENHRYETGGPGSRHVREALTRALSYEPQAVHLFSDNLTGGGQGATRHELVQEDLISLIHGLNNRPLSARIHTYQFVYQDPLVRAGLQGTLQRIAEETGGEYSYISPDRLMLR